MTEWRAHEKHREAQFDQSTGYGERGSKREQERLPEAVSQEACLALIRCLYTLQAEESKFSNINWTMTPADPHADHFGEVYPSSR